MNKPIDGLSPELDKLLSGSMLKVWLGYRSTGSTITPIEKAGRRDRSTRPSRCRLRYGGTAM